MVTRWSASAIVVPLLVYSTATVAFTWPLATAPATQFVSWNSHAAPDVLLAIWILRWALHALATNPATLFDGNILHPTPGVLVLSEHMFGLQPFFAPVWLASGNPLLALNVASLASFVLSALAMHLLVLRWTDSRAAAYASGCAFAFAP